MLYKATFIQVHILYTLTQHCKHTGWQIIWKTRNVLKMAIPSSVQPDCIWVYINIVHDFKRIGVKEDEELLVQPLEVMENVNSSLKDYMAKQQQ